MISQQAEIRSEIDLKLDWMVRDASVMAARYEAAAECGAALAATVYRYLEDPMGTGLDELRAAYSRFMAEHSGNFSSQLTLPTIETL